MSAKSETVMGVGYYRDSGGSFFTYETLVKELSAGGENTPNYHSSGRPKPLPINDYSLYLREIQPGRVRERSLYEIIPGTGTPTWSESSADNTLFVYDSELGNEAFRRNSGKILDKMKGMKVNVAQASAEASQTANLLANTARRITLGYTSLRKGDFVGVGQALKTTVRPSTISRWTARHRKNPDAATSSAWLELQYGWKPLLQDTYGAAETIARERLGRPVFHTVKAHTKLNSKTLIETSSNSPGSYSYSSITGRTDAFCKHSVTYVITNDALALSSSLGLTDPALLAWELLPYSFVVDWFLPVGDWLSRASATAGLTFHSGYYSQKTVSSGTDSNVQVTVIPPLSASYNREGATEKRVYFSRSRMVNFPINPLPEFQKPFSFTRLANSLALLNTAFRR